MNKVAIKTQGQKRWDGYGLDRLRELRERPGDFMVGEDFLETKPGRPEFLKNLGHVHGKKILELGCGRGELSVFLAKKGADVTGVDIGPHLVEASRLLAGVNGARCEFREGDMTMLPFGDGGFDMVVGRSVLHHLSIPDMRRALEETHRVLKDGGSAVFHEPVENSRAFDFIQNIIPAGRPGERYYRPSVLNRKAWRAYKERADNRVLTNTELLASGRVFSDVTIEPVGFLVRLERVFGAGRRNALLKVDACLFKAVPGLERLCQTVVVKFDKKGRT